uniref:Gonadoliberin n=1 Tax=Nothobranchius furzeri TaxID=105023 RepID=A0A8C6MDK3_NOTFU
AHRGQMALKTLVLRLLLVGAVVPLVCCQHWSFGLSPGGKRELDGFQSTLDNIVEGFSHMDAPCTVLRCEEDSPLAKIYRMKGFLGSVSDGGNGHKVYKK